MTDPMVVLKRLYPQSSNKALRRLHLTVSALPLTWAMLMCVYAVYARFSLGHWPRPMVESVPQTIFGAGLELVSSLLLLVNFFAFFIWIVLIACLWKDYNSSQIYWRVSLYTLGVAACIVFVWADPGQFFDWWVD